MVQIFPDAAITRLYLLIVSVLIHNVGSKSIATGRLAKTWIWIINNHDV